MNIGFERPLLLLGGIGITLILVFIGSRTLRDVLRVDIPLGPPGGASFQSPINMRLILRALGILELLGVLVLLIAAAGPLLISSKLVWLNRGADILFVIDVSPSMAGLDMEGGSRFDAARRLLSGFARNRPSDAIGLVAVGNDASLLIPPTIDRRLLNTRLESLRVGVLGDGTALGLGLAVAAAHIRKSPAPRRAVVLITDGENNAGAIHPETAAESLRGTGASLWVIGLGSMGQVPIDYVDPILKIRRTGSFDSRFNSESLRALAQAGGGTYIAAPTERAFTEAFNRIHQEELIIGRSGVVTQNRPLANPLIIAALVLLLIPYCVRRHILGALL